MKTVKIVVCDPHETERQYYIMLCRTLAEKHGLQIELKEYSHSKALLFDMGAPSFAEAVDVLFLETELSEIDGIHTATAARELGYTGIVLFLTHSTNHYEPAFDAEAFNYVRKGKEHILRFETVFLKTVQAAQTRQREHIVFSCAGEYRQIPIGDIQYFESRNHVIDVYYNKEHFEFVSSLTKLENQLFGRGFQRIHRSYLVSLDYIQKLSYDTVILESGTALPVGRKYYKTLKTTMDQWKQ